MENDFFKTLPQKVFGVITLKMRMILLILTIITVLTGCGSGSINAGTNKANKSDMELEKIFDEYTPKLDGAYAEGYASKLKEAYQRSDPKQFIVVLSNNDLATMEGIIKLLVSGMLIDGNKNAAKLEKDYEGIRKQTGLTRREKYAVYEILAQIVYYQEALKY